MFENATPKTRPKNIEKEYVYYEIIMLLAEREKKCYSIDNLTAAEWLSIYKSNCYVFSISTNFKITSYHDASRISKTK